MTDAKYCDDDGLKMVGEIRIPRTKESDGKDVEVNHYFGSTEVKVVAYDKATDKKYEGHFDFLVQNEVKFIK